MSKLGGIDEEVQKDELREEQDTNVEKKRRPFHYWKISEKKEYRLKLNTSMIEKLENKYRTNIMNVVVGDDIPPLSVMLTVIQAAMVPWEHGIKYDDVKNIYENWKENGGNQMQLYTDVVIPTMVVSGFFTDYQARSIMEGLKAMDELA